MEENKNQALAEDEAVAAPAPVEEEPLDKNVRLMSPTQMVLRRFFRSKLSIVGLIMVVALLLFCWLGPLVYPRWVEQDKDMIITNGDTIKDDKDTTTFDKKPIVYEVDGQQVTFYQVMETPQEFNSKAPPSADHFLGTDGVGYDVFTRLMFGGRISLTVSFIAVFAVTALGIVLGGIAGYFGGKIDNLIMRICDILMCLPGFPIMIIIGTILDSTNIPANLRIYILMAYLTLFSWPGTARLVRGQILSLREQEYMVAAEAMGYSTARKIFKHLVPNVMPQLIVSMTLSLGSMILYEASLSYLGMGVRDPFAAWGTMIDMATKEPDILANYFNIWGPPGLCIILAVLGFNFVGDGLRDALDPKMRR